ncbi:MAG: hypothetical protein KatS3mg121_0779 [Gammaproteobacteria bacterium]|nr:MAG: hypothetical protein KatS3mg121_0779 [Gammaproteobacteria bacterium]
MITYLAAFLIILAAVIAMALGVLLGGRRIQGSCGGLNTIEGLEGACEACTKPCERRKKALKALREAESGDA